MPAAEDRVQPSRRGLNFIQGVENEMHRAGKGGGRGIRGNLIGKARVQPPSFGGGQRWGRNYRLGLDTGARSEGQI